MSWQQWLGAAIIAFIFLSTFICMAVISGWRVALFVFSLTAALLALIGLAVSLLSGALG